MTSRSRIPGIGGRSASVSVLSGLPQPSRHVPANDGHAAKATEWANQIFRSNGMNSSIDDLVRDLTDGSHLPNLVQCLVRQKVTGIRVPPRSDDERRHNIQVCLTVLEANGYNLEGVSYKDLCDKKLQGVLDLTKALMHVKAVMKGSGPHKSAVGGDSREGAPRGQASGLKRPTTPTASFSMSIARPNSQSVPRLANNSTGPTPSATSLGTSSPAASPGVPRANQLGSPGTARGGGALGGQPLQTRGGSPSPAAATKEPSSSAKKISAPSRLATQIKRAESTSSVSSEQGTSPNALKSSGLKAPFARSRLSSPPSTSSGDPQQMRDSRKTHTLVALNSQLRRPSEPLLMSDVNSESEPWNSQDRSETPPDRRLKAMSRSSSNLAATRLTTGSSDSSSAVTGAAVPKATPGGVASPEKATKMPSPSSIAAPKSRRRNLSEGSTAKHSVLVRKDPDPSHTPSTSSGQPPVEGREAEPSKMPSKINKSSKGLFGGLIPQKSAATAKRSTGTMEIKSPLSSQKVGPKEGSSHQLKPDNLLVAGARRKVALAMGDMGGDDVDGGAASVHDASLPVKALVYTEAFQSEKKMGDLDDDALSSATGTTVRGRGSPCSIADISSLESAPSPLAATGGREEEAAKGKSLTMSELGQRKKSVEDDTNQTDSVEAPQSPKSPGPLGGERKSPDGGIGSPKEVGDTDQRSPTMEIKHLPMDKRTDEGSTTSVPSTSEAASTGPDYRTHLPAMPITSTSTSHPPVLKPQFPMTTASQKGDEPKYLVGHLGKTSPLALSKVSHDSYSRPRKQSLSAPGSPSGMGMVLGDRDGDHQVSHDGVAANGVRLRHHHDSRRHMSPPLQGETRHNLAASNLKKMNRLSRSFGEALDRLDFMDSSGELPSSSTSVPGSSKRGVPSAPAPGIQQKDDASSSDEEYGFQGNQGRKDMSSSPTELIRAVSPKLENFVGGGAPKPFSRADPRAKSFSTHERMPPLNLPPYTRNYTAEAKVFLDANGTLPRGVKVRRAQTVRQKWKDDMDAGSPANKGQAGDLTMEQEIDHWKLTAVTLEKKLSNTKFDLDKKGKMLTAYESNMANLEARLQHLENTLEGKEHTLLPTFQKKDSSNSLDSTSLIDVDSSEEGALGKEKGKKKSRGLRGLLKISGGKKGSHEFDHSDQQKQPSVSISMEDTRQDGQHMGMEPRKVWSSRENLIAEISTLRDQVNHLQQQNQELRRRSMSPRESGPASGTFSHSASPSPRRPLSYELEHPLTEFIDLEEGTPVAVVLHDELKVTGSDQQKCNVFLGHVNVAPLTSWEDMDGKVLAIFKHHVWNIDPEEGLGLTDNSICTYTFMGNWRDIGEPRPPPEAPNTLAHTTNAHIVVYLKSVRQKTSDLLSYQLLLNCAVVESYASILIKNKWLVLIGTKGSFKTMIASHLLRHLSSKLFNSPEKYIFFNMDSEGVQVSSVLEWIQSNSDNPQTQIVLVDGLFECEGVEQILSAASTMETKPYLVITVAQAHSRGSSLHNLMFKHPVRMVTCTPQSEPVNHILPRQLRRQILELKAVRRGMVDPTAEQFVHWLPRLLDVLNNIITKYHSPTVALGPSFFLPCPLHLPANELEQWFVTQWNHFIAPYVKSTVMAGIESYGVPFGTEWSDPVLWVADTFPWVEWRSRDKLQNITEEDVGLSHAIRVSPQASTNNSVYAPSVVESTVDSQSNAS